jgi:spore maturation protein CgeB
VFYVPHVSPDNHRDFYASSPFTLNITRGPMARRGFCPSGRLFEAGACESVMLTDVWPGLDQFFVVGEELISVEHEDDVLAALELPAERRREIGRAARARVLREHTSGHRAQELERFVEQYH